ncbi:MAG: DUF1464 family protein [Candidatus Caldarchaeum sp.]|nr:DUF1464 family protein [Candidatus Caldarchaeum sp.]
MRALGIDPGTGNFDFVCIENDVDRVVLDESIPSKVVAKETEKILQMILDARPDVVVGPSGYGLRCMPLRDLTDDDIGLTTLEKKTDFGAPVLSAVRNLLKLMKKQSLNGYTVPGIVQLPTVPIHRKFNKIDMGTADKTCVTAYCVWDQAVTRNIRFDETCLICVEMGLGYNAAVAVENGKIVDGIGGTIFPGPGFLSLGLMDGELAYLLGEFSKKRLFEGGVAWTASGAPLSLDEFVDGMWTRYRDGLRCFVEGVIKAVAGLVAVMDTRPYEVILTGRLSRVDALRTEMESAVHRRTGLKARRPVNVFAKRAKDVAMGAALVADGLGGGRYAELVEVMEIRKSFGTVLDNIKLAGFVVEEVVKSLRRD